MNKPALLFFITFGIFIAYSFLFIKGDQELLIDYIVDNELYDSSMNDEISEILVKLLSNTEFGKKYIINNQQISGYFHLYILPDKTKISPDKKINNLLNSLKSNCAFLGINNTIVCGVNFLRKGFLGRDDIRNMILASPNPQKAIQEHVEAFMTWVLAHEIGHIINRHKAAHFSANLFYENVLSASISQKQEVEADRFAYDNIKEYPDITLAVELLVLDLLNSEIRNKIGQENIPDGVGIFFDYSGEYIPEYACAASHPEYIVRSVRMLLNAGEGKGKEWMKHLSSQLATQMASKSCANKRL